MGMHPNGSFFAHPYPGRMKINSFVLGLAAASISASRDAKAQTLMTRVYHQTTLGAIIYFRPAVLGLLL
jgi:hypothetical protein